MATTVTANDSGKATGPATGPPMKDGNMKRMYETGEWSDLTIETATKTFKVHKSIVCPACPFFHAACTNGFKESKTGVIRLEESEIVVDAILRHIYELPIEWLCYFRDNLGVAGTWTPEDFAIAIQHDSMVVPANSFYICPQLLYSRTLNILELECAVDKYDISGLSTIINAAFAGHYRGIVETEHWVTIGDLVYARDRVANQCFRRIVIMDGRERITEIMKSPRLWKIVYSNEGFMKQLIRSALYVEPRSQ